MRRVIKSSDSAVVKEGMRYKVKGSNKVLIETLLNEQNYICAYTETCLGRSDKAEIDHFDPTLKNKVGDSYENWFLVKARWNSEKSAKWNSYQPVLHPSAPDLEKRILYLDGDYILADNNDTEAYNLRRLIKLDDPLLAEQRKKYIKRLKSEFQLSGLPAQEFIDDKLISYRNGVEFIRAIEEELNIKVNFDLLKTK